ncbi:MAG: SBBP repeat-containing protein, partial [Candidatus Thorarchaeota archaeon]
VDVDEPLVFSTLTGFRDYDEIVSVGLDNAGNIYAVGHIRQLINDEYDGNGFLYKINGSDFTLIYDRIFGGSRGESVNDMFVDPLGRVYIIGTTSSPDFPMQNAYCNTYQNSSDCFIMCYDADGEIIFSTYFGGEWTDYGESIFVDDEGSIYVTGSTHSFNFPLVNSYSNKTGGSNVFVAKLNSTGNGLVYSSIIGGDDQETGLGLTVDSHGNAYIAGSTLSEDFPTVNAYDDTPYLPPTVFGINEGFVFSLNSTGNGLIFSTFIGGSDSDIFYDIELNAEGRVWVCGFTESDDFPTLNSYQEHSDDWDGIIFELTSNGSVLLFSTILGGQENDVCYSMDFDERDNVFVTGTSRSDEFPLVRAQKSLYDNYWYSDSDCFVMKISPEKSILYSTFVGGEEGEAGRSIAVDENGAAIVGGYTSSDDFPTRREISEKYIDRYGDGFVFILLDIGDEDGDNIPNWWETANGYDPLNPEVPMPEFLTWYASTILMVGVVSSLTIIILWFGRHRIRSWTGRVAEALHARAQA